MAVVAGGQIARRVFELGVSAEPLRPRTHRLLPGVGHNLPQEAPEAFSAAVLELVSSWRAQEPALGTASVS